MKKTKAKLIIFASGTKMGGGSGFEKLILAQKQNILKAEIVAVVSNHEKGGVWQKANQLGINFIYFPGPFSSADYQEIIKKTGAEYVALSGWLKLVQGLDSRKTFNIHPGPLPRFGGKGMYGHHIHQAVMEAYKKNEVQNSEITMHFVTSGYDQGPVFFKFPVTILPNDTAETLGQRANLLEHEYQPRITNLVVNGEISWDGVNAHSLKVPSGYEFI